MPRRVAFIHTSHVAIPPLMHYYSAAAPELDIINLLDEGILRFFSAGNYNAAEWRFRDLISIARNGYRAEAVVVTCSAAPLSLAATLQAQNDIPILKIDVPMAVEAVRLGRRIGVAMTFPATLDPTTESLRQAASEAGLEVELVPAVAEGAYHALLTGRAEEHDAILLAAVERLVATPVDVVVLAQVSMARILPQLRRRFTVPLVSSIQTSLPALRRRLDAAALSDGRSGATSP